MQSMGSTRARTGTPPRGPGGFVLYFQRKQKTVGNMCRFIPGVSLFSINGGFQGKGARCERETVLRSEADSDPGPLLLRAHSCTRDFSSVSLCFPVHQAVLESPTMQHFVRKIKCTQVK